MPFITLSQAKAHLRIDDDSSDAYLPSQIQSAEDVAVQYMQRNIYADQSELDAAIAAVPAILAAARAAYLANIEAAISIEDAELSDIEAGYVTKVYSEAKYEAARTRNGIIIAAPMISAMLLILGRLFEVREDDEKLPRNAQDLLDFYRCYA